MQIDLGAIEAGTLVVAGTLLAAAVIGVFLTAAAIVALILVGVGRLAWWIAATVLLALVRGINFGWDSLVRNASSVHRGAELSGQSAPTTGTYPRVVLRDS